VPRHISSAARIHYGPDALARLGPELDRLGARRALLVAGRSLGGDARTRDRIGAAADGRMAGVFDGVRANSPLDAVRALVAEIERHEADALLALGGGSAMVTARAANILHAEGRDIAELSTRYEGGTAVSPRLLRPKLPMIALPTTPTTATAKAGSAVTAPGLGRRFELFDPKTRAVAVLVDPWLADSSPGAVTLAAATNAFAMAVEGIVSTASTYFSDGRLVHSLRTVVETLPGVTEGGGDRLPLILAAIECGDGTDVAGGGLGAALSHTLGHRLGIPNGELDAVVLPHVLDLVGPSIGPARSLLAQALDCAPREVRDAIAAFLAGLGLPTRLRDHGVPKAMLDETARDAMADFAVRTSPGRVTESDALAVLHAAW